MNRSWIWTLVAVLVVAAGSYAVFVLFRAPPLPAGIAYGSGHIEGTEVKIASEASGRVVEQLLIEGKSVNKGDRLVSIDPQTTTDQLAAAQGEVTALRNSRSALDAQITTWTHHTDTARQQVARIQKLADTRVASQQNLDQVLDAQRQAEGQLGQLRAQRLAIDGLIASADSRARQAQTQLGRTDVLSPLDGTVLVRAVESGEVVQAGQPLGLLVDLSQLKLKIYLTSDLIGRIRLDQAAKVRIDAFPDRYFEARIARVDQYAQFTPRDIHVPEERAQTVYGVELALANPEGLLKPGMPADAWIRWDDRQPWPARLPVPRD